MSDIDSKQNFYIFPITNINLFPFTTKPLNVFEPRFIETIHKSVQEQIPVALCFVPESSNDIRPVAGYAIPQIIDQKPDQSMLVFMSGVGKVLLDTSSMKSQGLVTQMFGTKVLENTSLDDKLRGKYVALSEVLVRWVTTHLPDRNQREMFIRNLIGPQEVIGAFAAYLIYDYDLQYEVMELNSLNEKIIFLYRLLESGRLTNV